MQEAARRIEVWSMAKDRSVLLAQLVEARRLQHARLPGPPELLARSAGPTIRWYQRLIGATDDAVRTDLAGLPAMLDRIDAWIDEGLLGGELPNAADYQIATSVRQLMTNEDLHPAIEGRPAGELAMRLVPSYPGRTRSGILPAQWLEPLRAPA